MEHKYITRMTAIFLAASIAALTSACSKIAPANGATVIPVGAKPMSSNANSDENLTNFCNGVQYLQAKYKMGTLAMPDVAKVCANAIVLQDELNKNPNLKTNETYSQKIGKACAAVQTMDMNKPGLTLQGDVKGTFSKLQTLTTSLAKTFGVSSGSVQSKAPAFSSAVVTKTPTATGKPSQQATRPSSTPTARHSSGGSTGGSSYHGSTGGGSTGGSTHHSTGGGSTGGGSTGGGSVSTGIRTRYGTDYGCTSQSQYDYVISKAEGIRSASEYKECHAANDSNQDSFQDMYGMPYSSEANDAVSMMAACGNGGEGTGSAGNAYNYFTGSNSMCGDKAKALEACLQVHGYSAQLRTGNDHMWVVVSLGGHWYPLGE